MEREKERLSERNSYLIGLAAAFVLTAVPFAIVAWSDWSSRSIQWSIALCAIMQILVHFRYFLHINLSRQKREDLQLILFSALLLIIMAAGTIWIMASLAPRMP